MVKMLAREKVPWFLTWVPCLGKGSLSITTFPKKWLQHKRMKCILGKKQQVQRSKKLCKKKSRTETFLVVQWLRIHCSMQRSQVWSLVGKPRPHVLQSDSAYAPQLEKSLHTSKWPMCLNENPAQPKTKHTRTVLCCTKRMWVGS